MPVVHYHLFIDIEVGITPPAGFENLPGSSELRIEETEDTATVLRFLVAHEATIIAGLFVVVTEGAEEAEEGNMVRGLEDASHYDLPGAYFAQTSNDLEHAESSIGGRAGSTIDGEDSYTLQPKVVPEYIWMAVATPEDDIVSALARAANEENLLGHRILEETYGAGPWTLEEKRDIDIDIELDIANQAFQGEDVFNFEYIRPEAEIV